MKLQKIIFLLSFFFLLTIILGCSDECDGENPTVRLVNHETNKADVQVKLVVEIQKILIILCQAKPHNQDHFLKGR